MAYYVFFPMLAIRFGLPSDTHRTIKAHIFYYLNVDILDICNLYQRFQFISNIIKMYSFWESAIKYGK